MCITVRAAGGSRSEGRQEGECGQAGKTVNALAESARVRMRDSACCVVQYGVV
jgi:hypothetical protein